MESTYLLHNQGKESHLSLSSHPQTLIQFLKSNHRCFMLVALAKMIPPHLGTMFQSNRSKSREIASIILCKIQSRVAFWAFHRLGVEKTASVDLTQAKLPPAFLLMMAQSWWRTTTTKMMTLV